MKFDYIIVGAGSAGCVLAERLSSDERIKVLVLEAGLYDKALSLKIPAAFLTNLNSAKYNWMFFGEPEPELRTLAKIIYPFMHVFHLNICYHVLRG